jgi:hypothetical protein
MMPMAAASFSVKSITPSSVMPSAPSSVAKIPNCAAAPRNSVRGFASNGPKSVSAPTPMKMMSGNAPVLMPTS